MNDNSANSDINMKSISNDYHSVFTFIILVIVNVQQRVVPSWERSHLPDPSRRELEHEFPFAPGWIPIESMYGIFTYIYTIIYHKHQPSM